MARSISESGNSGLKMAGPKKKKAAGQAKSRWSAHVTHESNALDLEDGIFQSDDPKRIAASLKYSAEHSKRRKSEPFRSAMSMLNFYINRAGANLPARQKRILERAKDALRECFGRAPRR
jgi:Protein of unknown function (DUF3175)